MSLKVNDDGTVTVTMSRNAYIYAGCVVVDSEPITSTSAEWKKSAISDLGLYSDEGMEIAKDGVAALLRDRARGEAN